MSWQELRLRWEKQPEYLEALDKELPYREISAAVVGLRVERGLTQMELAELAHTTQSVISRMESGRHSFEIDLLTRVSRAIHFRWRPVFEPVAGAGNVILVESQIGAATPYSVQIKAGLNMRMVVYTSRASEAPAFVPMLEPRQPDNLVEKGKALSA